MSRTTRTQKFSASYIVPLGILAAVASFGVGLKTAGTLETVPWSSADDDVVRGDVHEDGAIDALDVIAILEIAQGYRTPTISELEADPNGNGDLTVDDAIRVLRSLPR